MLLRYFSSLLLPSIFEYYTRIHAPLSTSRIVNDPPRHGNLLDLIPSLCFRCVTILVYWRSDWRREFNFIFFDRARLDYVSRKMGRGRKLLFTFGIVAEWNKNVRWSISIENAATTRFGVPRTIGRPRPTSSARFFIRCGIPRARATTTTVLRSLKSTANCFSPAWNQVEQIVLRLSIIIVETIICLYNI